MEHGRVRDLLAAALSRPPAQRAKFVAAVTDDEIRRDVESLLRAGSPDDDFLEIPAFQPLPDDRPRCEPGETLAGRFRIVRLLGLGGMGEVYQAEDLELNTEVALKTLRAFIADDPKAIAVFRREVLQARAIAHPNVCRVYDLFADVAPARTLRFLTMELVRGVTLASYVREHGPLPPDRVRRFAAQIGGALDEAHRRRIVHRDLKPGNVMITTDRGVEYAVVTDFGLSRLLAEDGETGALNSEREAGTELYLAPEQREVGSVGPAADLYAFGVLLSELFTGRPPESSSALQDVDVESGLQVAGIPREWREVIARCTRTDPRERPSSAGEALKPVLEPARSRLRASAGPVLVAVMAVVALMSLIPRYVKRGEFPPAKPMLLTLDLANETGDPLLNGATEMFRQQLKQSPVVTLIEPAMLADTLARMARPPGSAVDAATARDAAWRTGATAVVSGWLRGGSPEFVLSVQVEPQGPGPDRPQAATLRSFEARDRTDLRRAVAAAARWVRSTAGEPAATVPRADRPVDHVTSSSWEAVALFARAQALAAASKQDDALAVLAEAVRLDPQFALAYMRMGDIEMSRRRTEEAYRHWQKAIAINTERHVSAREDYRIRGMFANDTHDYQEAANVYRLYQLAFPNDFEPYFYLARPLLMLGRVDEAIAALREARSRAPNAFSVPAQLGMFLMRAGYLDEVPKEINALRAMGHPDWAVCLDGQLAFLQGRYDDALRHFASLEQSNEPPLRSRSFALQAAVLADLGRTGAARERLRRGVEDDQRRGENPAAADKLLGIAALALREGRSREARDACIQATQADRSPLRLAQAASLLAQTGAVRDALRLFDLLPVESASRQIQIDRARVQGEILLAQRAPMRAWEFFQRAAALESPGVFTEYLARGAAAAGETGTAIALYERMALSPGYFWRYPDADVPGAWFNAQRQYLSLTQASPTARTSSIAAQFKALSAFVPASIESLHKE